MADLTPDDFTRYSRQLSLPEFTPAMQKRLKDSRILVIGAGGLGAPALPYLAGAGIGDITIIDNDIVDPANLHRQTIFADSQTGQGKAEIAAHYIKALNPSIKVSYLGQRLTKNNAHLGEGFDLLFDGSDNFETKTLLNEISIATQTPLLSASVLRFEATAGLFAGYAKDAPCYACLFPELPENACNCNEAGVLGTAAGLAGLYQAHLALCFLAGMDNVKPGTVLSMDFRNLRLQKLSLAKDENCAACRNASGKIEPAPHKPTPIPLRGPEELAPDTLIIDVREPHECALDPIPGALNIPIRQLPLRVRELPRDRTIALICQANIRSRQGAEMLKEFGFEKVCVLDAYRRRAA